MSSPVPETSEFIDLFLDSNVTKMQIKFRLNFVSTTKTTNPRTVATRKRLQKPKSPLRGEQSRDKSAHS